MHAKELVRGGLVGGASFDIIGDDGQTKIGRVDLVKLPSGRVIWDKFDAHDEFLAEDELTDGERGRPEREIVEGIWRTG